MLGGMIDVKTETLLTLRQAATHPAFRHPSGRPAHISKIYRAVITGYRGTRLETINMPGGRRTSDEATARFIAQLNSKDSDVAPPPDGAARRARSKVLLAAA